MAVSPAAWAAPQVASEGFGGASDFRRSVTEASHRVGEIIDEAERAAAEIRVEAQKDARRQAQRAVNERAAELAAVVSPLVERVEKLRVEAGSLMDELQVVTERLRKLTRPDEYREVEKPSAEAAELHTPFETQPAEQISEPATVAEQAEVRSESALQEPDVPESVLSPALGPLPVAYPGTGGASAPKLSAMPEEALLRATQMAVAGSRRQEIEETLRDEFELDDPVPVVNDILGPAA